MREGTLTAHESSKPFLKNDYEFKHRGKNKAKEPEALQFANIT